MHRRVCGTGDGAPEKQMLSPAMARCSAAAFSSASRSFAICFSNSSISLISAFDRFSGPALPISLRNTRHECQAPCEVKERHRCKVNETCSAETGSDGANQQLHVARFWSLDTSSISTG